MNPLRQYVVMKNVPMLLQRYRSGGLEALQEFTEYILGRLGAPNSLLKAVRVIAAPSFDAQAAFVGTENYHLSEPAPSGLIIVLEFSSEGALFDFRELIQANMFKPLDEDGNAVEGIGADPGGTTAENLCPPAGRPSIGNRAVAHEIIQTQTLDLNSLRGQRVNVVIVDEGLDKTKILASNWGGGLAVKTSSGAFQLPGATQPASHGMMIARNVLAIAPAAVIYDVPLIPPRIRNVPVFINKADAIWRFLLVWIRILRVFPRWSGPWVIVNAWGIFDRSSEVPHGDYSNNPGHPFNKVIESTVGQDNCDVIFAAGNCGQFCPSPRCGSQDRGPGQSIHGANSHSKVLTLSAVSSTELWLGYSSQGPGSLFPRKPDLCAPSNFCEDRDAHILNTGTSASCAIGGGVMAALRSGWPSSAVSPEALIGVLNSTAKRKMPNWSDRFGYGILNAGAAVAELKRAYGEPSSSHEKA